MVPFLGLQLGIIILRLLYPYACCSPLEAWFGRYGDLGHYWDLDWIHYVHSRMAWRGELQVLVAGMAADMPEQLRMVRESDSSLSEAEVVQQAALIQQLLLIASSCLAGAPARRLTAMQVCSQEPLRSHTRAMLATHTFPTPLAGVVEAWDRMVQGEPASS